MRHGFGAMHGLFPRGDGTTIVMIVLLVVLVALSALIVSAVRRKNHPEHDRLMDILKGKFADRTIGEGEFRERSMVLGDEYWIEANGPEMMKPKGGYAACEIDSGAYVRQRQELFDQRSFHAGASFNERPVR